MAKPAIQMKKYFLLAFLFISQGQAFEAEPTQWFACKVDNDCVLAPQYCAWRAVNKKFEKAFKEAQVPNPHECSTPTPDLNAKAKLKAACLNSFCEIKNK